jgi:ABC-type antimicrobial peptide transport system permease subunit
MLKSYLKIAWRNLSRSKGYSFINIAGLATGMAIALLIGLWIADEVSFDTSYANHDRLVQVMITQSANGESYTGSTIAMPIGQALSTQYADDFKRLALASFQYDHLIAVGDKKLSRAGMWTQYEFPEMFSLQMIRGSISALKDPSSVLLAQSLATSLFGGADPINETIRLDNKLELKVAGVYKDLPFNTSFHDTKILLPWGNKENSYLSTNTDWDDHNGQLFAELADLTSPAQVSARIKNLPTPHIKELHEEALVYPLDKLHLYDEFKNGKATGGRIQFVWLFGIIGVFVLLLACINFMNLSTARSEQRAKEVGIRKTIGSRRIQLIGQFFSESILVCFLSFLLAVTLVFFSLPFFNTLAAKQMTLPWNSFPFWLMAIGFTLFTGILSGSYPALYLSAFDPVKVLKGTFPTGRYASIPRKVLVVLQFSVSLTLIIGTVIVFRQIQLAKDRPIGYSREGLITIGINTPELQGHYDALRAELLQTGVVNNMAESSMTTTGFLNNNDLDWRGKTPGQSSIFFRNVNVTPDFGKTIGWTVLQGRDFSRSFATDSSAMILNEAAAKIIGIKNPVGEIMKFGGEQRVVIGVVKDMVTNSPYEPVEPAIFLGDGYLQYITIRFKTGLPMREALAGIEPVFKKFNPGSPFVYQFNDDEYAQKFADEERIGNLATVFAGFAIFISCLGLFGLASFIAEQRTKEIGVRKVLGANLFTLWGLLSKDFIRLVFISMFIAIPLAYYGMHQWLQHYPYRTGMPWWIFAASGLGILLITLITVSFQSLKAAMMNPVNSLRTE